MLLLLTSLDDQINATEMGKTELCASCVISVVDILSQRLVIQYHDNDTLPDLANVLQKQSWQVLSRHDIETITACFTIYHMLEVYTKRIDR